MLTLNKAGISSTSKKVVFTNGVSRFTVDENVIQTPSLVMGPGFLFRKGEEYSLVNIGCKCTDVGSLGTFVFNINTGTTEQLNNVQLFQHNVNHAKALCNCALKSGYTAKITILTSNLLSTTTNATTELDYFKTSGAFDKTKYSLANKSPIISHNNIAIGSADFSSSVATAHVSGNNIVITNKIKTKAIFVSIRLVLK